VAVNTVAILMTPATTIPYHNIWISLAILYGYRMWRVRTALIMLALVGTLSGVALVIAVLPAGNIDEAAEIPMMSLIFLIMVWFAAYRQQAADERKRSAERERDFVRDASHQLRTPITVARGHAELIRERTSGAVAADADIVVGEMARLARISDRLLILASAQEPAIAARGPVALHDLLQETARRWETVADRRWQLALEARGLLTADVHQLEAALDSLIENAVKATTDGDRIAIALRAEKGDAVMEVADDGVGIDPANLERVFDRFWRASDAGRRNGGTGLGLSIVREIANGHGGSAEAAHGARGGATFRLRLPGFVPLVGSDRGHDNSVTVLSRTAG
jgi:signal transduction histidine kinase